MKEQYISFYRLANEGIDPQTLQRLRQDLPVTTVTLARLCEILHYQPGKLIEYVAEDETQGI